MLRTYPAFIPCSATSQNWLPIRPSPTGVRRGFPVLRPFVSSSAYPGSGRPIASASLIGGLRRYFWSVWTIRCFILCRRALRWSYQLGVLYRWLGDRHRFDPVQSRGSVDRYLEEQCGKLQSSSQFYLAPCSPEPPSTSHSLSIRQEC